jgi:hypothetical protein
MMDDAVSLSFGARASLWWARATVHAPHMVGSAIA